jgi:hypothetical protein
MDIDWYEEKKDEKKERKDIVAYRPVARPEYLNFQENL